MAGMSPISLQQFLNPTTGRAYAGARANFYQASTTTRIAVYSDYGLSQELPNPVVADAYGRFPAIFLDEEVEFYRLRLTTSTGSVLPLGDGGSFDLPALPIIGPATGGEGEVTIGTSDIETGDVIWAPRSGTRSRFVRPNGRTIGSAASGASERANADTEALYAFYWDTFSDTIAPVTGGRGASASADFEANKPIQLLNLRNKGLFGLAGMGNSDSGGFSGVTFSVGDATTPGSQGGAARVTLTQAQLPIITPDIELIDPGHFHGYNDVGGFNQGNNGRGGGSGTPQGFNVEPAVTGITLDISPFGGGEAHTVMNPFALGTFYQKL